MSGPDETPVGAAGQPAPAAAEEAAEARPRRGAVDDANDLRGYHFKRLMRKFAGPGRSSAPSRSPPASGRRSNGGLGGAAVAVILIAIVVFAIADAQAADSFFRPTPRPAA